MTHLRSTRRIVLLSTVFAAAMSVASAASAITYSAIAISPNTSAWGRAQDEPTMVEALNEAMRFCRQYSSQPNDCRPVSWVQGAYCSAVVYLPANGGGMYWGTDSAPTVDEATSKAYAACQGFANVSCTMVLTTACAH